MTVADEIPPGITCLDDIVAECQGNRAAPLIPGIAVGTDACDRRIAYYQEAWSKAAKSWCPQP